jgi:phytanoyl-CoA hydroxylase
LYRLCCAHTHSPGLEEVFFNKRLHREISFLFGEPAIAVQTLYFEYGSRQGQHRDTSVVSFNPLSNLLAAWVALEDIEEGTGELEYFPGSHRVENFFYPDGSIVWRDEYGPDSFARMDQGIRATAAKHRLEPERFLAKRSQALIWHHSLSHGGGRVTKPHKTRKKRSHSLHHAIQFHAAISPTDFQGRKDRRLSQLR